MENIKALVIDDCENFCRQAARRIAALGHECMTARHMEEARELLAANTFSYIILDMQIPEDFAGCADVGNGHLMLQEIRRTYGGKDIRPVIVVSGQIKEYQEVADLVSINEANDYLQKPLQCTGRTIEESITRCLRAARERRGIPTEQRPVNARPVAEWLRPEVVGGLTNWSVTGRNGVVNRRVVKSSFVLNKVLHCILKNNDKSEGVMHGDFLDACGWSETEYFKEQNGKFTAKRGCLRNYVARLKRDFGIECMFTDHGVLFVQPQRLEVEQ